MSETKHGPFNLDGVIRDASGLAHYAGLPASLVHAIHASVLTYPEHEAVVEVGGPRLTYAQLWQQAVRVAGGLRAGGFSTGDRAAILLPAGAEWVLAFLGTLLAGGVAVPVNTRFAEPEIEYVVADSGAAYVFRPGTALPSGPDYVADGVALRDPAAIFYTSGTTGAPKGAVTTHESLLTSIENAMRCIGIDRASAAQKRNFISVPLFHVTGCNAQLLVQLGTGGTAVILPVFDIATFLRTIAEERITTLVTVPAIHGLAIAHPDFAGTDISSVTRVAYGGAPIAPALVQRLMQAYPAARVGNGFGLSETSSLATYLPHEWSAEHADSVGFATPVVDLLLHEPDAESGVGELLIRGPNVVIGYWNKPEATAAAFVDGWLHTGDLARIDDEGLVYIVDRAKDMICRGGENVYSVEVENALAGAPGIAEAAVVGVPDAVMGEKVGVVVVPTAPGAFDPDAMFAHLAGRLADFKIPQYVAISATPLPRNPGGKVLKRQLRDATEWGPVRRGK
jgi:acyl-CoA synthetase (AMP-forming)/AMP-acid ligase II